MSHLFNEAKLKPKTYLSVNTQIWIRGKTNSKGYFTLQNKANGKLLTFGTSLQTKLAGLYNHIYNYGDKQYPAMGGKGLRQMKYKSLFPPYYS